MTKETKVSRDKAIEFQLIGKYDKEKEVRQGKSAPKVSNADGDKGNALNVLTRQSKRAAAKQIARRSSRSFELSRSLSGFTMGHDAGVRK